MPKRYPEWVNTEVVIKAIKMREEGMLSSCSPGITVMNIDNGYGAAMAALRIIKSIS